MRRYVAVVLLVAALALAACGGGSGKSAKTTTLTPAAYVKSAGRKTVHATSEHMTMKGSVAVQGQVVTLTGGGNFDNAHRTGAMHIDFSIGGLTGTGSRKARRG